MPKASSLLHRWQPPVSLRIEATYLVEARDGRRSTVARPPPPPPQVGLVDGQLQLGLTVCEAAEVDGAVRSVTMDAANLYGLQQSVTAYLTKHREMFCLRACYLEPFEPQSNQLLYRLVSAHPLRTSPKPLLESSCKLVRINICAVWTRHADAQRWPSLAALLAESPLRYALSHPLHRELPVALYSAMVRPFGSLFCGPLVKRRNEVEPLMRSLSTSLSWILAATDAESEDASARTMQADLYRALREMDERHVLPSSYKTSLLAASRRPALLSSHDALVAEAIRDLAEFERAERPEAAEEVEMLEFPPNNDKERNAAEEEWLKKCDVACLEEFERSWRGNRAGKMQDGAVCSPGGEGWASLPCFRDEGAQPAGALALADGWGGANAMPW